MKEKNDYGMYSGAYIFDLLDRAALDYVRKNENIKNRTVLVTANVYNITFRRQVCSKRKLSVHCQNLIETTDGYYCNAILFQDDFVCASATFTFTEATNHCEVR